MKKWPSPKLGQKGKPKQTNKPKMSLGYFDMPKRQEGAGRGRVQRTQGHKGLRLRLRGGLAHSETFRKAPRGDSYTPFPGFLSGSVTVRIWKGFSFLVRYK